MDLICTFIRRLNGNPFHGGDVPDQADFKLYAIMRKYLNCRKINFLNKSLASGTNKNIVDEKNLDFVKFDDWLSRMALLCSRNNFYNIRDVGYNYNRYMSEEVLESQRINKPKPKEEDYTGSEINNNINKSLPRNSIMGVFGNRTKRNRQNI